MAKRSGKQYKCLSAMVILMLLLSMGIVLVGLTIGRPYFNITQNMNLSQVLGRSDLNGSDWFNATTYQQPLQLIPSIVQQPGEGDVSGSQGSQLPAFLQETPGSQGQPLPAFLQ